MHGGRGSNLQRHESNPNGNVVPSIANPNQNADMIIAELQSMGAPKHRAMLAAQHTAYASTESALQWLIANMEDPQFQEQVDVVHAKQRLLVFEARKRMLQAYEMKNVLRVSFCFGNVCKHVTIFKMK
jgi:uncharacterized UBP type Zn finger protein